MQKMKLLRPFDVDLSGINLVEASAGTGKTYNITSLYIRALIEQDISVGKILVVTYTEAATKELKDRLLRRIRESIAVLKAGEVEKEPDDFLEELLAEVRNPQKAVAKLEQAVRMFDEASVYTIHGFCYQALQEQAFESGAMYDAEMIGDDSELVQEAVDDYWRNWVSEVEDNPHKKPLLKLLTDCSVGPESLARELGSYIGKPYLKILPEEPESDGIEDRLHRFQELHSEMQHIWKEQRSEVVDLLQRDEMSNYRSDWLSGWVEKLDEIFHTDTAVIDLFDQFDRFTQSRINNSLKKSAEKKGISPPQHPFFKAVDEYQDIAGSLENYEIIFKKDLLRYLRKELNQKKEDLQVLSYDDLLLRLRNALLDKKQGRKLAGKLREKYPIAMVDEFQDTDPNQYDIFRQIYKDSDAALFMIGDPKQSIYSFRGADVYSYIKARRDAPADNRFRLDRNFRSTPDLLRGLNNLWGGHKNPFVVDDIDYQEVTWGWSEEKYKRLMEFGQERPPIRFRRLSEPGQDPLNKKKARQKVARDTAKEIQRLLEGGKKDQIMLGEEGVEAKDIAVLVRKHKQADLITEALRELDIKSVQHSEQSVYESEEATQLEQLLKAVAEPANETLIKTSLSLPLTGHSAAELFSIEEDDEHWSEVLQQFTDWHKMWQNQGFAAMFRSLMMELNIAKHVIKYPDGERRLTNLLHLGELLQEESQHHKEGTRSLLHWLGRKRQNGNIDKRDEEQMRLESDEDLVKVVTMHKSKGLQYPIVFCPFLWHGPRISDGGQPLVYHKDDDNDTTYLDLNGKADPERARKRFYAQREELAESLRLAYVAMTRAEHCLYLTWEFASATQFSSLGYLLQDPKKSEAILKSKVGYGDSVEWSGDEMHFAIEKICNDNPDLFTLKKVPDHLKDTQLEFAGWDDASPIFKARSFEREIPLTTSYQVSSFSSLTSWMDDDPDMPDYDQFLNGAEELETEDIDEQKQTIFTFPKGPEPGTCIHKIFEEVGFQNPNKDEELITDELTNYGIDTRWKSVVAEMLQTVISAQIHPQEEGLTLGNIAAEDLNQELEFYYKSSDITSRHLLSIIRDEFQSMSQIHGQALSGFLKGFIDLTFQFDGKFYLLDYKTNYLGDTKADYRPELLKQEMQEASYDLQYHIYTIALHRFLKQRIPDYSYEEHFGGAFYLFLRGMNADGREGIFFDHPDYSVIEKLDEYILSEGKHEQVNE